CAENAHAPRHPRAHLVDCSELLEIRLHTYKCNEDVIVDPIKLLQGEGAESAKNGGGERGSGDHFDEGSPASGELVASEEDKATASRHSEAKGLRRTKRSEAGHSGSKPQCQEVQAFTKVNLDPEIRQLRLKGEESRAGATAEGAQEGRPRAEGQGSPEEEGLLQGQSSGGVEEALPGGAQVHPSPGGPLRKAEARAREAGQGHAGQRHDPSGFQAAQAFQKGASSKSSLNDKLQDHDNATPPRSGRPQKTTAVAESPGGDGGEETATGPPPQEEPGDPHTEADGLPAHLGAVLHQCRLMLQNLFFPDMKGYLRLWGAGC
ncbi:hypothetical protein CEXT_753011, partial [Caerostris extrusa]